MFLGFKRKNLVENFITDLSALSQTPFLNCFSNRYFQARYLLIFWSFPTNQHFQYTSIIKKGQQK